MKRSSISLLSLFLTIGTVFFLTACSSNAAADNDKPDVRIAYFPNITHTQALILKNQQTLEKTWADKCNSVSWTAFHAGPAEIEAIFSGEIDLGYIGPVPALNANVKSNGEVQIISNASNAGAVLLVRKDSGIQSVKDLSGKKVAVPQLGNTQHLCLLNLLSEHNLKPIDQGGNVTINATSNANIFNLMNIGHIDAAVVPEPWGTIIEQAGNTEILLNYDELFLDGNYPTAVVVANGDFTEDHPELVQDFLEMHKDATLFINENPDEAHKIVNKEIESATGTPLASSVIENAFSRLDVTDTLNKEAIMTFASISKEEGFTYTIPEVTNVFNTEFTQ